MNKRSGPESREKIIAAAMEIFSSHGYAAANIRAIAEKAGTSVGSIYLYFRNKEDLYKSLIRNIRSSMIALTESAFAEAPSATHALCDFIRLYIESALKHREFFILHITEHGFTFDLEEKKRFLLTQTGLVEKIIAKGIASGEFRKSNARETAKLFLGSLRGILLSVALKEGKELRPAMVEEFLLHGLLRGETND
jgi:AcrR family transcriptional regulator